MGTRLAWSGLLLSFWFVGCGDPSQPAQEPVRASFDFAWTECPAPGLSVAPLPPGEQPVHTSAEASDVARRAHVGPESNIRTYAASVKDPFADKVGLGSPETARTMWVVDGQVTATMSAERRLPADTRSPGTISRVVTLIDDATLGLGGNFFCGEVSSPSAG
jgi:hypothetical protein